MTWALTEALMNTATLFVLGWLVKSKSPDRTQACVMFLLFLSFMFFTLDGWLGVFKVGINDNESDPIWRIAVTFMYIGVLLGIWRIFFMETDKSCRNSLAHYRNSARSSKNSG